MKLSERLNITMPRTGLQGRNLDGTTRNRLWSAIVESLPQSNRFQGTWMYVVYKEVWANHLKIPIDEMPQERYRADIDLKTRVISGDWYESLDLIEFLLQLEAHENRPQLQELVRRILDEEKVGFRLFKGRFVEITDEHELATIEEALASARDEFHPVRAHLDAALRLYSDKREPDYRNSIKESISAVVAAVQIVTRNPKARLSQALAILESNGRMHGAFVSALKSLYGYTSDSQGIRHALMDESTLDAADAKFMLGACAAFVVYLRLRALEQAP